MNQTASGDSLKDKIFARVKDDLSDIEIALKQNLTPYLELVSQTAGHLLFSGGKRLRPLLMVLAARICGYQGAQDKKFSTIFEYLHAATLLHDDLVDGAELRRGKPVAHAIWGSPTTVLVGDFLLARALSIAAETQRMNIIKIISEITEKMSQGEIHQLMEKGNLHLTEADYMEIIRNKTAVLIRGACRVGALIADQADAKQTALADYGFHLGMAFQMADDLLDYTSHSGVLGKKVGADLKEGKLTLPVIYALRAADASDRDLMQEIIQNKEFSIDDFNLLIELLNVYGGLKYTQDLASEHIAKAKEGLSLFSASPTREILFDIADYALARRS